MTKKQTESEVSMHDIDHSLRPSADYFKKIRWIKTILADIRISRIYRESRQNSVNLRLNVNNCG